MLPVRLVGKQRILTSTSMLEKSPVGVGVALKISISGVGVEVAQIFNDPSFFSSLDLFELWRNLS